MIKAAIDIGTNTILMVVADYQSPENYTVLADEHRIARLGAGTDQTGIISEEAKQRALVILTDYKRKLEALNAETIKIAATSAMRDARNREEIIESFRSIIGAPVSVIPGEEEAELSFLGSVPDERESMVIDIGGGSTELISGRNLKIDKRISMPIGAVRITERCFKHYPPQEEEILSAREIIRAELKKTDFAGFDGSIYAAAGTATAIAGAALGLAEFSRTAVHGFVIRREKLREICLSFLSMTPGQITDTYRIEPGRADLIGAGALILSEIFDFTGTDSVIVTAEGLRYGILKYMK